MAPTTKQETSEKTEETQQEKGPSGHDRLDEIVGTLGHTAQDDAIRALVEFVRETTPDSKLGKRSADEETEG